jgi:predicted NAD/FAD-binding protein
VSCAGCGLGYAGQRGLGGLAAGLRGGGLRYARMLAEVIRFHRAARRLLAAGPGTQREPAQPEPTLGQFLAACGYSAYFIRHFALPFVAAVWSCPPQTALSYPARYLFAFLNQHGLLSVTGSPPWLTVRGGSRSYVERIAKQLTAIRTGARVTAVSRVRSPAPGTAPSVSVTYEDADGTRTESFDAVVIATHHPPSARCSARSATH